MPPTASALRALASTFCEAFTTLSTSTYTSLRSPTCTHIFAPASVSIPPKTNAQFAAHMDDNIRPLLDSFPVTAKEVHVNESGRQVTIWATGVPKFKKAAMGINGAGEQGAAAAAAAVDVKEWEYVGEYIFILDVNEDGEIERVLEFLDSKQTDRLRGLIGKARKNLGQGESKAW